MSPQIDSSHFNHELACLYKASISVSKHAKSFNPKFILPGIPVSKVKNFFYQLSI